MQSLAVHVCTYRYCEAGHICSPGEKCCAMMAAVRLIFFGGCLVELSGLFPVSWLERPFAVLGSSGAFPSVRCRSPSIPSKTAFVKLLPVDRNTVGQIPNAHAGGCGMPWCAHAPTKFAVV